VEVGKTNGCNMDTADFRLYVHGGNDALYPSYTSDQISILNKASSNGWVSDNTGVVLGMHCISQMDATTIFISGGYGRAPFQDCRRSTYFFSQSTLTPGPDMISQRAEHGCSFINDQDGIPTAIVVGGYCNTAGIRTKGVEIFNRKLNIWESGPSLPIAMNTYQVKRKLKTLKFRVCFSYELIDYKPCN